MIGSVLGYKEISVNKAVKFSGLTKLVGRNITEKITMKYVR